MGHVSVQDHLEAGQGVVAQGPVAQDAIDLPEWCDLDVVVEDDRSRRLDVALDSGALQEDHLGVVVRVGPHLELAPLKKDRKPIFFRVFASRVRFPEK